MWRPWCKAAGAAAASSSAVLLSKTRSRRVSCDAGAMQLPVAESIGVDTPFLSIFTRSGQKVSLAEVIAAAGNADVVFVGETHDDPVAHQLELYMLATLNQSRPCALSMEMFESDVQGVIDEYMAGLIEERDFLNDARPWPNYFSDYRMLVEYAKELQIPVIAANVPRRYVGAVGRRGWESLKKRWPASSAAWIPSEALRLIPSTLYMEHIQGFLATRNINVAAGSDHCPCMDRPNELTSALILWDAAMASSIAQQAVAQPDRIVFHVCGSFHVEYHLGICEMMSRYREATSMVVVAIYPEEDCQTFDSKRHADRADFVILTDASLPRS